MSAAVWVMVAIALWHFTVLVPDRFYGGIVGAFLASLGGALALGFRGVRLRDPDGQPARHRARPAGRSGSVDRTRRLVHRRCPDRAHLLLNDAGQRSTATPRASAGVHVALVNVDATPDNDRRPRSLLWRVFAANAAVLVVACALLVLTPITISAPVATVAEAAILLAGLAVMVIVNLLLLRRSFAPLRRLATLMTMIDPMEPGRRLSDSGHDAEVATLTHAFNSMLDRLELERRDSGRRALAAQEQVQAQIARELHDEIGQTLTAIAIHAQSGAAADDQDEAWSKVAALAQESLEDVRRIGRDLRPEALDDLGLVNALIALCTRISEQSGIAIERRISGGLPARTAEVDLVIYRVAQESLTNVMRHSGAERAAVSLDHTGDQLVLVVRDEGTGFTGPPRNDATGIRGMRERAMLIGGRVSVRSKIGVGTEVRLEVPAGDPAAVTSS
jgi:two-component system sensor histidine kinase UhpB